MTQPKSKSKKSGSAESESIPAAAWYLGALGLLLVISIAGFMIFKGITSDATPPSISFAVKSIVPTGSAYAVETRITNSGGSAAAGLVMEGVLNDGTSDVETRSITIDYVPAGSERIAGLFFTRDPRKLRLQLQAVGYEQP